jgi:phosphate starvation-inducible protein PhoH
MQQRRLSRKEKRKLRQSGLSEDTDLAVVFKTTFKIKPIRPLTTTQEAVFDHFQDGKNILLHGVAGTGKSFISLALALYEVMMPRSPYQKVIIVRSVVPTREMGFLPGKAAEKAQVYEAPYMSMCSELFDRGDAYGVLKNKGILEFISTSFIRGITLNDTIIIVDEIQNMDFGELDSVITRIGKNCKVILCGDFRQTDFRREHEKSGIHKFMSIIKRMKSFVFVEFGREDIVRSDLVKDYIITKDELETSV